VRQGSRQIHILDIASERVPIMFPQTPMKVLLHIEPPIANNTARAETGTPSMITSKKDMGAALNPSLEFLSRSSRILRRLLLSSSERHNRHTVLGRIP